MSAAMLTNPRALKQHLANGTSHSSHFEAFSLPPRRSSEPPHSRSSSNSPVFVDLTSKQITKDDAYHVFNGKGKNASKTAVTQPPTPAFSSQFDPRRLLDPKAFGKDSRKSDEQSPSIMTTPSEHFSPLRASPNLPNGEVHSNGAHKRDHDNTTVPGMGSLIERVHNVSQREERPQKKQKIETFEEDDKYKKNFGGGGKGGEIGEYIKQKKKEGIEEDGSSATIVDLTGGMYTPSSSSACYLRAC